MSSISSVSITAALLTHRRLAAAVALAGAAVAALALGAGDASAARYNP